MCVFLGQINRAIVLLHVRQPHSITVMPIIAYVGWVRRRRLGWAPKLLNRKPSPAREIGEKLLMPVNKFKVTFTLVGICQTVYPSSRRVRAALVCLKPE